VSDLQAMLQGVLSLRCQQGDGPKRQLGALKRNPFPYCCTETSLPVNATCVGYLFPKILLTRPSTFLPEDFLA